MSCYDLCPPTPCGPTPLANSCNEPCVRQCQDSTVVIQPSPVVVTLPGPILSSFPQNTAVGSSPGLGSGYSRPYRRYNTYRGGFYGPC
nr:PREDICTED: feather keratin 2-like [Haliaeetus albicilla]